MTVSAPEGKAPVGGQLPLHPPCLEAEHPVASTGSPSDSMRPFVGPPFPSLATQSHSRPTPPYLVLSLLRHFGRRFP